MTDGASEPYRKIRVRMRNEGTDEVTTFDHASNPNTSNYADILYYSGHGHSATGELECWDSGGRFTVSEVNPAANWREDLDYFIIAGCSVLRPDATNSFAWGNATLKQGILRGLCGYHDAAPADSDGAVTIAEEFAQRVNSGSAPHRCGDLVLDAWLEVNRLHSARGIAYNQNYVLLLWRANLPVSRKPVHCNGSAGASPSGQGALD